VNFRVWPDFKEMHGFTRALLDRASHLPGVTSAAVAGNHPLDAGFTNSFQVVGREAEAATWPEISVRRVTPGYFRTVGLALVRGRLLADADTTSAAPVLLVNEAAARRFFAGRDPLGSRIRFWGAARTIVGVVANERFHGLTEAAPLAVYLPLAQAPSATGAGVLLVRTNGDPMALASAVRGAIHASDPALAAFGVEPLRDAVSRSVGRQRFTMVLLLIFAGVALVLAAIGIHGVLSYTIAQRTREIGIRVALGARPSRVLGRVVLQGLTLALGGVALGFVAAVAVSRFLASLLFGVEATDPATFAVVGCVLAGVAAGASYLPARRAIRVDPAVALRAE
jgi:putative ABC transport system permease protein